MEETAVSIGKSVLKAALGYAKSAVAEEVALQLGVQRDKTFVTGELEMMQSFLMVAHNERDDHNKVVRTWVKQVRDVAYDVEDSLQDFSIGVQKQSWWRIPRTLLHRRQVAKQMKELRAKVEDVSQRNLRYRLIDSTSKPAISSDHSTGAAATMFGIDEARRHAANQQPQSRLDLAQLILKKEALGSDQIGVIGLWGTSGTVGHTSIISEAYENEFVKLNFPCRAWVRVKRPFHPKEFVQSVVKQFRAATIEMVDILLEEAKTVHELALEYGGCVNEKRYLIVLTDLSTIEEWHQIRTCFPKNKLWNRIVVSTKHVEVASLCSGQESMASELKQVSADQTIYAFYQQGKRKNLHEEADQEELQGMNGGEEIQGTGQNHMEGGASSTYPGSLDRGTSNDYQDIFQSYGDYLFGTQSETSKSSQDVLHSSKPASSSTLPYSSENEIQEYQTNTDVDGKLIVQGSITRTNTMAGVLEEFQVIGRDREKSDIIGLILEEASTQKFQVIAVWGMGGLGKTTLIKDVYQSKEVNDIFGKHAFVTVLRPFKLDELLRTLAVQLYARKEAMDFAGDTQKNIASMGVEELTEVLGRLSQGKSCLFVLDDLSSTTEWDIILPSLLAMRNPSLVIVITTRREDIAKYCCKKRKCIRLLNGLKEKDACNLFKKKVFKNETTVLVKDYPELVEPAKLILKRCNGLPLAIVTIGGFLGDQPTKTVVEWRRLNEHISVELEMNPKLGAIKTVLMKSFDGLPYYLKSCFLYLCIFPEDRNVSRSRLVCRWVAEGYARDRSVADRYFMELIERSMIIPTRRSLYSRKGIDSCQLHDLIRDISIVKSMEEDLVFRLEEGCSLDTHGAVRHLSVSSNWKGDKREFESTIELSRIRSLTVFGKCRPFYISYKMRFLRVLDLEGTDGLHDYHLEHIGKLLHLRYLSLRWCTDIYYLPDSVGNLRQLETLDIKKTRILRLPKTITKLTKLRYLKAGITIHCPTDRPAHCPKSWQDLLTFPCCMPCWAPQLLGYCEPELLTCCVPGCMRFNRRCCQEPHFNVKPYGVKVPTGTGKLKSLHTLRYVQGAKEIKGLTSLRKLGVFGVNPKNGPEFCSAICSLSHLESLSVWSHGADLYDCLQDMNSPPENLQSLKLGGCLKKIPGWIKSLKNLVKIKLVYTEVLEDSESMQVLGNLPNLSILSLREGSLKIKEPFTFQSGLFKSLSVLELEDGFRQMISVKFEPTSMPKLEVLHLVLENSKTRISGLEFLPSIKEVWLDVTFYSFEVKTGQNMTDEEAKKETKHREEKIKEDIGKQVEAHPGPERRWLRCLGFFLEHRDLVPGSISKVLGMQFLPRINEVRLRVIDVPV